MRNRKRHIHSSEKRARGLKGRRESLDNSARNWLHLSSVGMEMISLAADLCFTRPLSQCQSIYQCEPGALGQKRRRSNLELASLEVLTFASI